MEQKLMIMTYEEFIELLKHLEDGTVIHLEFSGEEEEEG